MPGLRFPSVPATVADQDTPAGKRPEDLDSLWTSPVPEPGTQGPEPDAEGLDGGEAAKSSMAAFFCEMAAQDRQPSPADAIASYELLSPMKQASVMQVRPQALPRRVQNFPITIRSFPFTCPSVTSSLVRQTFPLYDKPSPCMPNLSVV